MCFGVLCYLQSYLWSRSVRYRWTCRWLAFAERILVFKSSNSSTLGMILGVERRDRHKHVHSSKLHASVLLPGSSRHMHTPHSVPLSLTPTFLDAQVNTHVWPPQRTGDSARDRSPDLCPCGPCVGDARHQLGWAPTCSQGLLSWWVVFCCPLAPWNFFSSLGSSAEQSGTSWNYYTGALRRWKSSFLCLENTTLAVAFLF